MSSSAWSRRTARTETEALLEGSRSSRAATSRTRARWLEEMDLDAVLARQPAARPGR